MLALELVIQSLGNDITVGFEVGDGSGGVEIPLPLARLLTGGGDVANYVFPNPCQLTLEYSHTEPVAMQLRLSGGLVYAKLFLPPTSLASKLLTALRVQIPLLNVQEEGVTVWRFFLDADNAL